MNRAFKRINTALMMLQLRVNDNENKKKNGSNVHRYGKPI